MGVQHQPQAPAQAAWDKWSPGPKVDVTYVTGNSPGHCVMLAANGFVAVVIVTQLSIDMLVVMNAPPPRSSALLAELQSARDTLSMGVKILC